MQPQEFKFTEVGLDFLLEKVGQDFFDKKLNPLIIKSYDFENSLNVDSVNVGVLYHESLDIFQVWDTETKEFLIQIERIFTGETYFCKAVKLLRANTKRIFEDFEDENESNLEEDPNWTNIYYELQKYYNLKNEFYLSEYFFSLGASVVDHFGLNPYKTKVIFFDFESLIIDGEKAEYINTELDTAKMTYILTFFQKQAGFKVSKITETALKTEKVIHVHNFFMEL